MRIAVISDIHGNMTALEAVLADLRETSPDLILHGGDLTMGGPNPAEVVDRIRDLGWQGVLGNADEAVFRAQALEDFASQSKAPASLWTAVREMAAWTCEALGPERIAWLSELPMVHNHGSIRLVHASPTDTWRSPGHDASEQELQSSYGSLGGSIAVYGHIHRPYVRRASDRLTVVNTGSVSQSFDGDPRASYLLLDASLPTIRRVTYDVEREIASVHHSGIPYAGWIARTLQTASPQMP